MQLDRQKLPIISKDELIILPLEITASEIELSQENLAEIQLVEA